MTDFNQLREYYSRFLNTQNERILFTGHSHQAWPDVSRDAQIRAWDDAAKYVDDKWNVVFGEVIPSFQKHVARRLGESAPRLITTGQNTLEFLTRLFSSFTAGTGTRVVSTTSEFHSLSRLLDRFKEQGADVIRVETSDPDSLTDRIVEEITETTTCIAISLVFYDTGFVLQDVGRISERAREVGATLIYDAYHAFNVVPFSVTEYGENAYYFAAGYKYMQAGEAAAWMRIPENVPLRPLYTGWFAEFGSLEKGNQSETVHFADDWRRFLGATFDPTPFYRANAVFDLMDSLGLTTQVLRKRSLHLTDLVIQQYDQLKLRDRGLVLASPREEGKRGGFISFRHPRAQEINRKLKERNVYTDARGSYIRMGPAPYMKEEEIEKAMIVLEGLLSDREPVPG